MNAELFLRVHLSEVSLDIPSLRVLAEEAGISWSALKRAKRRLGVRSIKRGFPARVVAWRLPRHRAASPGERVEFAAAEVRVLRLRLRNAESALEAARRVAALQGGPARPPLS